MQENTGLTAARKANNNTKMGRRVGLFVLLAVFTSIFISATAQENDAKYWIKEGYKQKWKGLIEESSNSFERALEIYNKSIDANPQDIKGWENMSSVLLIMNRTKEAISVMDDAIERNPGNPEAWNGKGFVLITIAANAAANNPNPGSSPDNGPGNDTNNPDNGHGNNASAQEFYNESLKAFEKALQLDPRNAEAWRGKGVVFSDLIKYSDALMCFNNATNLNPLYGQAWRSKGILLLEMGQPDESIKAMDQALKINPNDIDAMTIKAQALSALGRYDESAAVFDRAMKTEPEPVPMESQFQSQSQSQESQSLGEGVSGQTNGSSKKGITLVLDGNSGLAASIFDSADSSDDLDEKELGI